MANPQTENGHVEIANDLWEALMAAGLNKNEYRAVLCILRYSYGVKLKYAKLRKKEIAILTRIPLPKVNETLTTLEKKNIIRIAQNSGYIYFHKDYDKWQLNERLTFDDKWRLQVNETLSKNLKKLTKREVKLNETLTSTSKKASRNKGSKGSKESKESIKESKDTKSAFQPSEKIDTLIALYESKFPQQRKLYGLSGIIKMREMIEGGLLEGVAEKVIEERIKKATDGTPWKIISQEWLAKQKKDKKKYEGLIKRFGGEDT